MNRIIKIMGGLDDYNWLLSLPATLGILKTLFFHKKPKVIIQELDQNMIEQKKKLVNASL
jgi:hypothetical protein